MIVLIDNYDSFTYNLVQEMGKVGAQNMVVYRNDKITIDELIAMKPAALVVSPGPCTPNEAGISMAAIVAFTGKIPILGVCLGHQSAIQAFGGRIIHARHIMHGKTSKISHTDDALFAHISSPFEAGRYHSLVGERQSFPACLRITAESDDGEIMAFHHCEHPTFGVQFHPESVLTSAGPQILRNFLRLLQL
jgi:anthranilate synthase/aminodeoxychorismate synthase-like glutamine amidotransferase